MKIKLRKMIYLVFSNWEFLWLIYFKMQILILEMKKKDNCKMKIKR